MAPMSIVYVKFNNKMLFCHSGAGESGFENVYNCLYYLLKVMTIDELITVFEKIYVNCTNSSEYADHSDDYINTNNDVLTPKMIAFADNYVRSYPTKYLSDITCSSEINVLMIDEIIDLLLEQLKTDKLQNYGKPYAGTTTRYGPNLIMSMVCNKLFVRCSYDQKINVGRMCTGGGEDTTILIDLNDLNDKVISFVRFFIENEDKQLQHINNMNRAYLIEMCDSDFNYSTKNPRMIDLVTAIKNKYVGNNVVEHKRHLVI